MSTPKLLVFITLFAVVLANCVPLANSPTLPPTGAEEPEIPVTGYQPVEVGQVEVEVGVGSPIPVQVVVSGNLPDSCAQIDYTEIKQEGSSFTITLATLPSNAEGCIQDTLPFRMMIPLNIVNLPAGAYSVEVNGSRADFKIETGNTTSSLPALDSPVTKNDVPVDSVNVEIGVGSPIPVHAIVALSLPSTCAQLGEIRLHREGTTFFVRLIADIAERPDCKADLIPFRLEIPLNIVNLPEGPYEVIVNGVSASFDPNTRPSSSSDPLPCSELVDVPVENGQVSYNGTSFAVDHGLGNVVKAQNCEAVIPSENQAPGEAHPPYTAFFFPDYRRPHTDFKPEIRIYEVTGDMELYLSPLDRLEDLKTILDQGQQPLSWFAAPLHAREDYLDFASGAGVRGLVQYMQDFFFTNNGLIYEFHGLTQDGHHFVSVRYPVRVPFLLELDGFQLPPVNLNPEAIAIPEWPGDFAQQRQLIEAYNTEAVQRFEQMADHEVVPDIAMLDQLVQSIRVNRQ